MIAYTLGAALVYAALLIVGIIGGWTWFRDAPNAWAPLGIAMGVIPVVATYLAAELVHRLRPRRIFDPRVSRPVASAMFGSAAGITGAVIIAVLLVALPDKLPDAGVTAIAGAVGSGIVALLLPRVRSGRCIQCGYDLAATPGARCPECGAFHAG